MTRVVFALERDAKTDRPEDQNLAYPTDRGVGVIHPATDAWLDIALLRPFNPQPSVWYDLRLTEGEALTINDLRDIRDAAVIGVNEMGGYPGELPMYVARTARATERLRAALDALDTKEADRG